MKERARSETIGTQRYEKLKKAGSMSTRRKDEVTEACSQLS